MNALSRTVSLLKITFHSHQIYRCRQQGKKLIARTGSLYLPQLITLTRRIDRHGILLYQLERHFEV